MKIRVGYGYDVHKIVTNRPLYLGGILIDAPFGLLGHSDADVLIHAICDALLGAANLRDIGFHFPDTSAEYECIDSKILLQKIVSLLRENGYEIGNIDCTICTEKPKINPHIPVMQKVLAEVMRISIDDISIKATTSEQLGFVGREEGMASHAVALITKL